MTIPRALRDGIGRVNRAPAVLAGIYVLTFLVALPLGLTLRGMIAGHLGESLAADRALAGVNYDWWQEFSEQAAGLGTTFTPTIIGFGAVLDNLGSLLDDLPRAGAVAGAGAAYMALWIFLAGGVLDRYARNRPVRAHGFFGASGVFFFRFLRLFVFAWIIYAFLFGPLHGWLFDGIYAWATRDFTVERNAFAIRASLYVVFGALLVAVNVLVDYAKVRAVVEDRRSMLGALAASVRFVRRNPLRVFGLYAVNGLLFLAAIALYALVAPGADGPGWPMWRGFLVGQLYLLARLWVRLVFYASETALFQGLLAHAEYAASPVPVWPESPAAEAIGSPEHPV